VNDPSIKTIILDFDSPGGEAAGAPELAALVRAASEQKTVIAFTDATMGSAAYYFGSQASEIVCTPSAALGSIGCYVAFMDQSVAADLKGLKMEVIKSGDFKGIGLPGTSLTNEQRNYLQEQVDNNAAMFRSTVQAARPAVADEAMQGQVFVGQKAVAAGMADALVNNFDDLLSLLAAAAL
jgi:signal peptide peptidase SppA